MAPQAYTKETLAKAFDWLQHQPQQVKQVATSPDVLVGLFLKAQRQGITNIDADAPVSSKKFMDDLKNLKKDFAPFEEADSPKAVYSSAPVNLASVPHQPPMPAQPQVMMPMAPAMAPAMSVLSLDEGSLQAVQLVQQRFNLSTPQEALRMLISVGAQHISRWQ